MIDYSIASQWKEKSDLFRSLFQILIAESISRSRHTFMIMPKKSTWTPYFEKRLLTSQEKGTLRSLSVFDSFQPGYLLKENKRLLNLCANDYLGLAADPTSLDEGKLLADVLPSGAGASRLVTGNLAIHEELEKLLAEWKGTERSLVFAAGYQTNIGVIPALVGKGDCLYSDKLNHASLIDGCMLSGAAFHRYKHCDMKDLQSLLQCTRGKKKLIITDGVFSMDGDICPVPELIELTNRFGALLLIDDAHATGVLGSDGSGSLSHFGLPWQENIIIMGTLSKAIGCQGGFVCASKLVIDYLVNFCRSFIFSTGISPWIAAMAHFNISRIRSDRELLNQVHNAITALRSALRKNGIPINDLPTPIMPIIFGESHRALQCAHDLLEQNIVASAIRPPTVPEGTSRIRLSISAAHEISDLNNAASALAEVMGSQ